MSYKDLWIEEHESPEIDPNYQEEKAEDNLTNTYWFEEHDPEEDD